MGRVVWFVLFMSVFWGCAGQKEAETAYSLITGSGDEVFMAICVDSDGSVYAAGTTTTYGAGNGDLLLAKFDADLNLLWIKAVGDSDIQTPKGIAVATDAIYVCGDHQTDAFLAKLDKDGNLLWVRTWDDGNLNSFKSILVQGSYIYVVGSTHTSGTESDAIIVKFASDGSCIWSRQWGSAESDSLDGIVYANGAFWLVGYVGSGLGTYDIALIRITETGNNPDYGVGLNLRTGGDDRGADILAASPTRLIIAGTSDGFSGSRSLVMAEIDISAGSPSIIWSRYCDIGTGCTISGLSVTPSGYYAVCGSYSNKPLYVEVKADGSGFYPYAFGGPNLTQGSFTDGAAGGGHIYLSGWADTAESMWSPLSVSYSGDANFNTDTNTFTWTAPSPTVTDLTNGWSVVDVNPSGSGGKEGFLVRPH